MKRLTMTFGAGLLALAAGAACAQNIRIGLQEDPDVLDPHRARTYVGRIVFTSLCDKLVDIDPKLHFVPQLATSWSFSPDNKVLTFKATRCSMTAPSSTPRPPRPTWNAP
ncbi:ABC-type oligopeptide transport system%2C periplasmic component [Achromobacter sp. 2789STDY5608621]|nr:ABC-type oligopeptide transport system%2C periplasmic component [Achromobacter sp. 2789STDY5608621]